MTSNPETIAKLCVNILLIALIAISAIHGWRKGIASVILSCFSWFICIVGAIFATFPVRDYIVEKTSIDDAIMDHLKSTMNSSITGSSFFAAIPEQIRGTFTTYQQSAAIRIATSMGDTMIKVLAFLISLLAFIVLVKLLAIGINALSKKEKGPLGIANSLMGGAFGLLRGVLLVGIAMLALFPLLSFADPRALSPIVNGIRQSEVAGLLYDNNPLLLLFQMF